jgi:hypothetical protein
MYSSSSSYPNHAGEVPSSSFFHSSSPALAHAAMMPWEQQQASAAPSSRSTPEQQETSNGSAAAAEINEQQMLPADFSPHEHSVVCGRGNKCINAPGSQRLKLISSKFLHKYAHTKCKKSKAIIVADIIALIRSECPNGTQGAFVRFHQNRWWEVDELGARQKVTTVMRDGLHTMYKSSSKSKVAKRRTRKVLEHRRQESVPPPPPPPTATCTNLEPVTMYGAIANNHQKTQDMFQRTFAPKLFCDQNKDLLEEGILRESLLGAIAPHAPSRSTFFHQQYQQEKPSATTSVRKTSSRSSSRLQEDTMQRRRRLLGHLEQAERTLEMFEPLQEQLHPSPPRTMHVRTAGTPSLNNKYTSEHQQRDGISVVTPTPPAFMNNLLVFSRRDNHEEQYASSCSSSITGDDNDIATPAPFCAPSPVDASFDIDNIFD